MVVTEMCSWAVKIWGQIIWVWLGAPNREKGWRRWREKGLECWENSDQGAWRKCRPDRSVFRVHVLLVTSHMVILADSACAFQPWIGKLMFKIIGFMISVRKIYIHRPADSCFESQFLALNLRGAMISGSCLVTTASYTAPLIHTQCPHCYVHYSNKTNTHKK